ncbi:MAG: 7,8-didemethyl-8-hydroxy-5-deazariboflavin synthase subunit CofG [Halodesulfurarchaeum sp.]
MIPGSTRYDLDIEVSPHSIDRLLEVDPAAVTPANELTFARNVFLPLTTACRYTCTYCTFYDPPGEASLMTPGEIRETLDRGVETGCSEALFTLGDDPDSRYDGIDEQLDEMGHDSIHAYLREAATIALETGILPHANPGDQTREQMALIADRVASMGVMLETTAEVDAHAGPRGKSPAQRLATIRTAGELRIPFTTGILVGIGEDERDRAESILAIADLHERFGHVQEVIVQPVTPNDRWTGESPDLETMRRTVAMARTALPPTVSVQVPPNLARIRALFDAGIDDLGGVSPVTVDHVNPSSEWPAVRELEEIAEDVGVPLRERLPVYERFLPASGIENEWISADVGEVIFGDTVLGRRYRSILGETGGPRTS